MITPCKDVPIILKSKLDMTIKKCLYDKTMARKNMAGGDYIQSILEGDDSDYQEGWKERRRQALARYVVTPIEEDPSLFWDSHEFDRYMANHELVRNHMADLLEDPPAWIGCSDGKIVIGESKLDVVRELKACSYPRLFINVVG